MIISSDIAYPSPLPLLIVYIGTMSRITPTSKTAKILILTITLLMSGCSGFGFLFERLDWLMVWQLDRMFDLSTEQEEHIKPKTIELREWLRNEGFPKVTDELNHTLRLWNNGKLEAAYHYMESTSDVLISAFLVQLVPVVQTLSLTLTEANAEHYRQYNNEKQKEWFEYAESDESKADARIEQLEKWFGHLSDQQITTIKPYTKLYPDERQIRVDNNNQWREKILAAALARDTAQLQKWIESPDILWTKEYASAYYKNKQDIAGMMNALLPTLTIKQKNHATDRALDWISRMEDTR
ncbi:DUF6279 family lipoprotein [Alkalimarinus alittae]|uniref:DUF6279 family lipoprotein n=1 Tax=Alkalimarinus alittae TaxID=2961619 RepID=A0ABY6N230_9ALTE|nr:DUF6279 family lipoprotein [Alkalimarinus alittae]UZE96052.1 DUF6279 family lipoprotein [Alkalimarinus alittae]